MPRTVDLPIHFRTGLRAVGIVNGRPVWPILGAEDNPANPVQPPTVPTPPAPLAERGYPANTPVADMTDAQQAAYHLHQSRKHEDRVKAYGGITPEQVAELREAQKRLADIEAANASDGEKREKAARDAARAEADNEYRPRLAETAFRVAIGNRLTDAELNDFITETNMSPFIKDDGSVDTAKVLARVERLAPAKGTPAKGPTVTGHGSGGSSSGSDSALTGRELFAQRHKQQTA